MHIPPVNNRWITNKALLSALDSNSRILRRVMKNNSFLLQGIGISVNEQLRRIAKETDGFRLRGSRLSTLKSGKEKKADITICSILANYHGVLLEDMMTKDFWNE